jgi:hypothetical protein
MSAMTASTHYPQHAWRHIAGIWLAIGLFDATQTVVSMRTMGMQHAWTTLFIVTVAEWAAWALFTPVALGLLRHYPLPARRGAPWLVHTLACVAIGAVWSAWSALLEHAFDPFAYPNGPDPFWLLWRAKFIGNLVGDTILYGAIVALGISLEAQARLLHHQAASARLAELLAQAQLAALRLQLEPHFIFNALNAITALIREQKDKEAIATTAALGDLLRRVTDRCARQFVSMEDEIDFLSKYMAIQ